MKRIIVLPIVALTLISPQMFAAPYDTNLETPDSSNAKDFKIEKMDAIEIILRDHTRVKEMLTTLDKSLYTNKEESRKLFKELEDFVVKHETMEQKVWYPALEKQEPLKDIISELKEEEETAAKAFKEIDAISNENEWVSRVKKLKIAIEQHAEDEEAKLFPKVQELLNRSQLNEIGEQLRRYRSQNGMNTYS